MFRRNHHQVIPWNVDTFINRERCGITYDNFDMRAFPPIDKDNLAMPILFPSHESLTLSIDNGIPEDYHLVRLYHGRYSGWFYRQRLQMVADLLKGENRDQLLEVGVGSGVFIPELLKYANQVTGIDIHETYHGVQAMLMNERIDLGRVCL